MQVEHETKSETRKSKSKMIRIAGYLLPRGKRIDVGLTYIFGIGYSTAGEILVEAKVNPSVKCCDLTNGQSKKLRAAVAERCVAGTLKRNVSKDIKRLIEIKSWRGRCHRRRLPVRGQRTKTNACTRKNQRGA
jgi:small subunit ribosomal protein S13